MAATINLQEYDSDTVVTATGLAALPTSSTLVAGFSLAVIDNTSTKNFDHEVKGEIKVGTTPTANTVIEVWAIPRKLDTPAYFDTFDGTAKTVTVTARAMLRSYGKLLATIEVDTTTTGRVYPFSASVRQKCGLMPPAYQLFVVHNTGVNLDATGSNFTIKYKGQKSSSGN